MVQRSSVTNQDIEDGRLCLSWRSLVLWDPNDVGYWIYDEKVVDNMIGCTSDRVSRLL